MPLKPIIPQGQLRILETTDLHMHLLAYNYYADREDDGLGLLRMSGLIARLRDEVQGPTLLCDNGDFLQGNPLADHIAQELPDDETHPMIAAMNTLGFDAITLGNHEFDYGLPFLRRVLRDVTADVVSANIKHSSLPLIAEDFTILTRDVPCDDGITRQLKIGITGFGPPQFSFTDGATTVPLTDIVATAERVVPLMKAAGADIIMALAHCGIGQINHTHMMENAAVPLAAINGIDALLLGHTHAQFPDPDMPACDSIDPVKGSIHGKPAVMAGFYGQSLGVIDLSLGWADNGWHVAKSEVRLMQPTATDFGGGKRAPTFSAAHTKAVTAMRAPIARTRVPIQSHLATVTPDLSMQLLALAMTTAVQKAIGPEDSIIAAVAPFRFGGRNGLGQYIDIPPGPVTLRDAAAIFPFSDHLCAVRRSGAQIKAWLERSASHYAQITPHQTQQPLINPLSPHYNCDTLYGMRYEIDLCQPARFDAYGAMVNRQASRIRSATIDGLMLRDDKTYTVAMNCFRMQSGGNFDAVTPEDVLWKSNAQLRDILILALREIAIIDLPIDPVWRFVPIDGAKAQFRTEALATPHLPAHITLNCAKPAELAVFDFNF